MPDNTQHSEPALEKRQGNCGPGYNYRVTFLRSEDAKSPFTPYPGAQFRCCDDPCINPPDNIVITPERYQMDGNLDVVKISSAVEATPEYKDGGGKVDVNATTSASCRELGGFASSTDMCEQRFFEPSLRAMVFQIQRNQNCTIQAGGGAIESSSPWENAGTFTVERPVRILNSKFAAGTWTCSPCANDGKTKRAPPACSPLPFAPFWTPNGNQKGDGPRAEDIIQGPHPNCWMVAFTQMLAASARGREIIKAAAKPVGNLFFVQSAETGLPETDEFRGFVNFNDVKNKFQRSPSGDGGW